MQVILIKDVEKLGKKYDIKEVASGYARNYLIPKGLAVQASGKLLKWVEDQKSIEEKKAEEELKKVSDVVSKIDGLEIEIPVKIGKEGQLFEKVNQQKILEDLKKLGFKIKKSQVELEKPLEQLGEFPVKIKFEHNLEAEIKVIITEEK
jgi:large subunit ribosomal protein L9